MRAWLTLLSLLLVDICGYQCILWLREVVRVSCEIELSFRVELAFWVGGLLLLVGIPLVGWHVFVHAEDARESFPRARVIR